MTCPTNDFDATAGHTQLVQWRRPSDDEWALAERRYLPGTVVNAPVVSHHHFGYFLDLGGPIVGLVEIPYSVEDGDPVTSRTFPAVGTSCLAVVLFAQTVQRQIRLSARPSDIARART